ncbi:replication initiator [Streptomyces sp. NPDC102270]|uniref:replication initiator n=1 Tax=Streptomyces sp. NPDC102270 TaxID=3366150 RepID=UPI0038166F32
MDQCGSRPSGDHCLVGLGPAVVFLPSTGDLRGTGPRAARRLPQQRHGHPHGLPHVARWGVQIDVRPLRIDGRGLDDDAGAAYVAKYVTKGASETGAGLDHSLSTVAEIDTAPVNGHVRTLMRTCWRLGGLPEYAPLRLRAWAHTLGYRGHILTKSRVYSTTYAVLRAERADHMGHGDLPDAVTERHWRYVGSGHTPGAAFIAAGIADDLAESRRLGLEARREGEWCG